MCSINPTNLINTSASLMPHAAVRKSLLFYMAHSQGRGTFEVKQTEVIYAQCTISINAVGLIRTKASYIYFSNVYVKHFLNIFIVFYLISRFIKFE